MLLGLVTYELRAAPDEWEELEVIQTPDSLAASWFHSVGFLEFPHNFQVSENKKNRFSVVGPAKS